MSSRRRRKITLAKYGTTTVSAKSLADRLPHRAQFVTGQARAAGKIQATDIYFVSEADFAAAYRAASFGGNALATLDALFTTEVSSRKVMSLTATDVPCVDFNNLWPRWPMSAVCVHCVDINPRITFSPQSAFQDNSGTAELPELVWRLAGARKFAASAPAVSLIGPGGVPSSACSKFP